jgi:tetratricopeptide (TPR) repeat protein
MTYAHPDEPQTQSGSHFVTHWQNYLGQIGQLLSQLGAVPRRFFISYAWESDKQDDPSQATALRLLQKRLQMLRADLLCLGLSTEDDIFLDIEHLSGKINPLLEQKLADSDVILVICTPTYRKRAKMLSTGVNVEYLKIREFLPIVCELCLIPSFSSQTDVNSDEMAKIIMSDTAYIQSDCGLFYIDKIENRRVQLSITTTEYERFISETHIPSLSRDSARKLTAAEIVRMGVITGHNITPRREGEKKFIPIQFNKEFNESVPPELRGILVHNFTDPSEEHYRHLLTTLSEPVGLLADIFQLVDRLDGAQKTRYRQLRIEYGQQRLCNLRENARCEPFIERRTLPCAAITQRWDTHRIQGIAGPMGSGKTQWMLNYALEQQRLQRYDIIHWLSANDLVASFKRSALRLGLPVDGYAFIDIIRRVFDRISGKRCLLLVDGLNDTAWFSILIQQIMVRPHIHLLFTTRNAVFPAHIRIHLHSLESFAEAECLTYLTACQINFSQHRERDVITLRQVATKLGLLPRTWRGITEAMHQYHLPLAEFLQHHIPVGSMPEHLDNYRIPFEMILSRVLPDSLEIIELLAYVESTGIIREDLATVKKCRSRSHLDRLLMPLSESHLIQLNRNDSSHSCRVSVEPFLAVILRTRGTPAEQLARYHRVVEIVCGSLPPIANWQGSLPFRIRELEGFKFCVNLLEQGEAFSAAGLAVQADLDRLRPWVAENGFQQGLASYRQAQEFETMGEVVRGAESYQQAIIDYREAIKLGSLNAAINLYQLRYKKNRAELRDEEALRLLQRAADSGHAEAMYQLAVYYYQDSRIAKERPDGRVDCDQFKSLSLEWMRRAAAAGNQSAIDYLRPLP